ncbi:MAG: DUF4358 domain-containing protein [Ruminiclostridium sp.]|nr:DUF4358 domain-containing protein [Ruminiclostridium sp.]
MKKVVSFLTVLALLITISGCSSNNDSKENNNGTTSASVSESENNVPQKTAAELADIVLNSVEFPQTVKVTDTEQIEAIGVDLSLTEEIAVVQQMLSVDVVEIVIAKVKDGSVNDVVASLQKRKESLIHDFAFYPGQVESAEATVVGSKGDIAYLICHKDADTAEKKLLEEIG